MSTKNRKYIMQTRCPHCDNEQYALNVYTLSTKGGPCTWCGKHIEPIEQDDED